MSKAKGQSQSRALRRNGWSPGRARGNSKGSHYFKQPTMVVERLDYFGKPKSVIVPKTTTVSYEQRVFKNSQGEYPFGSKIGFMQVGGNVKKGTAKYRDIMLLTVTKEVPVKSIRVNKKD